MVGVEDIIRNVADKHDFRDLRDFLNVCFDEIAQEHNLDGSQFQKRAKLVGDSFEYCFHEIMKKLYPEIEFVHNVKIPAACMERGGNADFVVYQKSTGLATSNTIAVVIEAKGSSDRIVDADGNVKKFSRPGMMRTDTVKKAISNAYQISKALPDALFFIVTSHVPTSGNAKCMCDLAEHDIVDKIVDVTDKNDLDEMARMIWNKIS